MDNLEDRVRRVQARRKALLQKRQRTLAAHLLLLSVAMFGGLLYLIGRQGTLHRPTGSTGMAASSLLDSAAGGYVLVALLAFCLGVLITVLCRLWIARRKQAETKTTPNGGEKDE